MTQKQANELFEGSEIDMAKWYANTVNLFLTTVFYVTIDPMLSAVCLLGTFFAYWVEKYLLL